MPNIGKIGEGTSDWKFSPIQYFIFSYDNGTIIDVSFPSVLKESKIDITRESDCWKITGEILSVTSALDKIFSYLNANYTSTSERNKLVRIEIFFTETKYFIFHRDNSDVLLMDLISSVNYENELRSFLVKINFKVLLKRDTNFSNIYVEE